MDHLRKEAKAFKVEGRFEQAVACYARLYSESGDEWIGFEYAQCLKKLGRIDLALEISVALHHKEPLFEYNKVLLAWLLYEKHFSHLKDSYSPAELKVLYSTALFATELVSQSERTPYVLILLKLLKILKKSGPFYEDKLLHILEFLNPSLLSAAPRISVLNGKERIYQSEKEMYYALKTKALYHKKRFDACLTCCDEALAQIHAFHHNNDLWIQVRKALCMCAVEGPDVALQLLEAIAIRKPHWVLFVEIARLYLHKKDHKAALLFYCRAAVTPEPVKMKVTLLIEMAELLTQMGNESQAIHHALYTKRIREKEGWASARELKMALSQVEDKGEKLESLKAMLHSFWISVIRDHLGTHKGVIVELQKTGKAGYIACEDRKLFFRPTSIVGCYSPTIKDTVQFCVLESYDERKKIRVQEVSYLGLS